MCVEGANASATCCVSLPSSQSMILASGDSSDRGTAVQKDAYLISCVATQHVIACQAHAVKSIVAKMNDKGVICFADSVWAAVVAA